MHRVRNIFAWLGGTFFIVVCLAIIAALIYRATVVSRLGQEIFITHPAPSSETPKTDGAPYEAIKVDSHGRTLQAWIVDAGVGTPAVLLFNGNGLTRPSLAQVQAYLFRHHVSSMNFDYSGFGSSTGTATVAHLNQDSHAAWRAFTRWADNKHPLFVLGYSLGTAVALHNVPDFTPQPRGVIVYGAFSSAKNLIAYIAPGIPKVLVALMPDVWDSVDAATRLQQPLLVVAGMNDTNVPPINGRQISLFARAGGDFVLVPDAGHGGILDYGTPKFEAVWRPILAFIASRSESHAQSSTPVSVTSDHAPKSSSASTAAGRR